MFGIHAFYENQDAAGAYTAINAVADQTTKASGTMLTIPKWNNLIGAVARLGATAPGIPYFDCPSLRRVSLYDIHPVQNMVSALISKLDSLHPDNPVKLVEGESLQCYENSTPTAAAIQSVIVFLSDGAIRPVVGEIFSVQFTASITCSAGIWVSGNITLLRDIPFGRYNLVGAHLYGTNLLAGRFIFTDQTARPGMACGASAVIRTDNAYYDGLLGIWGEFHSTLPPMLELLSAGANTSQTGFLQIQRFS